MSIGGFEFGLAAPFALIALPLGLGILIYAYLKRGRGTPMLVPSVLILKMLERAEVARKNFVPPLRFFLELLLLTLLIVAAAGIYSLGGNEQSAVLIDNSFSMSASDPANPTIESYLEQALTEARLTIESGKASALELFVTSPNLRSISNGFVSRGRAISLLSEIRAEFAADSLQSALERLSSEVKFKRILVFTDKAPAEANADTSSGPRIGHSSRFQIFKVRDERVTVQNIALTGMRLFKPSIQGTTYAISVTVSNFSNEKIETQLTLEMQRAADDPKDLKVIRNGELSLDPKQSIEFTFENLPALQIYKVALQIKQSALLNRIDGLLGDDQGWLLLASKTQEIAVISPENEAELGFSKLKGLSIKHIAPDQVSEELLNQLSEAENLIIFHNVTPPNLPPINALFITPTAGDQLFNSSNFVAADENDLKLTSWSDSHPITTYLNLPALKLSRVAILQTPTWAQSIISSSLGTLALAGEYSGRRYAAFGFDLLPFRGKDAALRSVLFLNSIKWLTNLSVNLNYEMTNRPIALLGSVAKLRDATGTQRSFNPAHGIAEPGLYSAELSDGTSEYLAVNYFDPAESNLLLPGIVSLPTESLNVVQAESSSNLRNLLITIALMILLFELLTWGLRFNQFTRRLIARLKQNLPNSELRNQGAEQ